MPKLTMLQQDRIDAAADLAREVGPDLEIVLLTHYPDVETLDTIQPGETDLATVRAMTAAAAAALLEAGVDLLVQRADRAAFRRWMSEREDTPETRRSWIDRGRLLRGPAALELLGLSDSARPPAPSFGPAPGPVAERLLEAFGDDDGHEFDVLVQALMTAGRIDILDLAVRKLGEHQGDEAGDELNWALLEAAAAAPMGPSGWSELVALPVALPAGEVPDGEALGAELIQSGALADSEEVHFLPGWRSPEALAELSFGAVRRVLLDLVAGKAPRDLPPGDTDELTRRGFGVLLGLRTDWSIPIWDDISAAGGLPDAPDEDADPTPEEADRAARFDSWRGRVFQESQGCVPLAMVAFSDVANEIAEFLAEAGEQTVGLEDIRTFVTESRRNAGGDEVVCRLKIDGDDLGLALYTATGHFLDALTMPGSKLPVRADQMPPLINSFVRVVQDDGD